MPTKCFVTTGEEGYSRGLDEVEDELEHVLDVSKCAAGPRGESGGAGGDHVLLEVQDQHEHREPGDHRLALDELSHLVEGATALEVAQLEVLDLLERRLVSA